MNTAQGLNCKIGETASNQGRINADYLNDLDQQSLQGKISISIQDPELKKHVGIFDTGDYNAFNLQMLSNEVNRRYSTSIDYILDLQTAKRVSRTLIIPCVRS